jgi:hypothetical protein
MRHKDRAPSLFVRLFARLMAEYDADHTQMGGFALNW